MAVKDVQAIVGNEVYALALNNQTGRYEASLVAPSESDGRYGITISATDDMGNVATIDENDPVLGASLCLTVIPKETESIMGWIEPKTNWTRDDRFNIQDYNRIKNNLIYLHEKAQALYQVFQIQDMGEDKADYSVFFYADEFNLFEQNLETINQKIFTQDYGMTQAFYDNGPFIQWDELNRIESATLTMMELLNRQEAGLPRFAFRLGNVKGVKG